MPIALTAPPDAASPPLHLRPWRAGDLSALVMAHRDPILRWWLRNYLDGADAARRWLAEQGEGWEAATRFSFAVTEGDTVVGHVALTPRQDGCGGSGGGTDGCGGGGSGGVDGSTDGRGGGDPVGGDGGFDGPAEVEFWTVSAARGRGRAPRAVRRAVDWGRSAQCPRPVTRIDLRHDVANHAACRVAAKAGFPLTGTLPRRPPERPTAVHHHVCPAPG